MFGAEAALVLADANELSLEDELAGLLEEWDNKEDCNWETEFQAAIQESADLADPQPRVEHGPRGIHTDQFDWGVFSFRSKSQDESAGRPYGGWQAQCPFHKKSNVTFCRRYLSMRNSTAHEEEMVLRALKWWCLSWHQHDRQRSHVKAFVSIDAAPPEDLLEVLRVDDPPTAAIKTDVQLDTEVSLDRPLAAMERAPVALDKRSVVALGQPAPKSRAKGKAKRAPAFNASETQVPAKAKANAKSKSKAKAKAPHRKTVGGALSDRTCCQPESRPS